MWSRLLKGLPRHHRRASAFTGLAVTTTICWKSSMCEGAKKETRYSLELTVADLEKMVASEVTPSSYLLC